MYKLLFILLLFISTWSFGQGGITPNTVTVNNWIRVPDTLTSAPDRSIAVKGKDIWIKDTTWKKLSGSDSAFLSSLATKQQLADSMAKLGVKYANYDIVGRDTVDFLIAGRNARLITPTNYNYQGTASKLVVFFHFYGGSYTIMPSARLTDSLLANGYGIVAMSAGDGWGNERSQQYYSQLYNYVQGHFNFERECYAVAESMGSLAALNIIARNLVPIRAFIDIIGVVYLKDYYTKNAANAAGASIRFAYNNVIPTLTAFDSSTYSYDPYRRLKTTFGDTSYYSCPTYFLNGGDDTVSAPANLSRDLYNGINNTYRNSLIQVVPGVGHDTGIVTASIAHTLIKWLGSDSSFGRRQPDTIPYIQSGSGIKMYDRTTANSETNIIDFYKKNSTNRRGFLGYMNGSVFTSNSFGLLNRQAGIALYSLQGNAIGFGQLDSTTGIVTNKMIFNNGKLAIANTLPATTDPTFTLTVTGTVGFDKNSQPTSSGGSLVVVGIDTTNSQIKRYPTKYFENYSDSLAKKRAVDSAGTLSLVTQRNGQTNYRIQIWDSLTTLTARWAFFFGDSWTAGVAATVPARYYVNRLGTPLGVNVSNRGTTGATAQLNGGDSSFLGKANLFPYYINQYSTPFFFFMYGVNDIRLSDVTYTPAGYSQAINACIDTLFRRGWPANKLYPITAGYFKTDNQAYIDARALVYNDTLAAICARRGLNFIDVYTPMKAYGSALLNVAGGDSLHLNDVGHDTLSRILYRAVISNPLTYTKSQSYFDAWGLSKMEAISFPRQTEVPSVARSTNPYITGDPYGNGAIVFTYPNRSIIRLVDSVQVGIGTVYNISWPKVTGGAFSTIMSRTGGVSNTQIPVAQSDGSYLGSTALTYNSGVLMMGVAANQIVKSATNVNFSGTSARAIVAAGRSLGTGFSDLVDSCVYMQYLGSLYSDPINTSYRRPGMAIIGTTNAVPNGLQLETYTGPMRFWVGSGASGQYNEALRISPLRKFGFGDTLHYAAYDFKPFNTSALTANNVFMVRNTSGDSAFKIDNSKLATFSGLAGYDVNKNSTLTALSFTPKSYVDSVSAQKYIPLKDFYADSSNSGTSATDMYSYIIPANTLNVDFKKVEANYGGSFVGALTATKQLTVQLAGNTVFSTGTLTISALGGWSIEVRIMRTSSTTCRVNITATTPGASTAVYTTQTTLTGIDFTVNNMLKLRNTSSGAGAASGDIVAQQGNIVSIAAAP